MVIASALSDASSSGSGLLSIYYTYYKSSAEFGLVLGEWLSARPLLRKLASFLHAVPGFFVS